MIKLPLAAHFWLMLILQPLVGFGAAVVVIIRRDRIGALGVDSGILAIVLCIVGAGLIRLLFSNLIFAKWSVCGCGMKLTASHPITYQCKNCANTQRTKVSEGE